jgi:hypothetical protein
MNGCLIAANSAADDGGAVYLTVSGHAAMSHCTIAGNTAPGSGSVMSVREDCTAALDHCLLAFNSAGEAVECQSTGMATLDCCDVFGNAGGDWVGCLSGQETEPGNMNVDPLFCNAAAGNYSLQDESPCSEENNIVCGRIGAYPADCDISSVNEPARGPAGRVTLYAVQPNPATAGMTVAFDLPGSNLIDVTVTDVQGRIVKRLAHGTRTAGRHRVAWDGLSSAGRRVTPGVYYIRLTANDQLSGTRSVIVIE